MRRLLDRKLLLPAETEPFLGYHARAVASRDFRAAVAAARVDHDHFIGEGDAGKAFWQLCGGVVGNQDNGQGQREVKIA